MNNNTLFVQEDIANKYNLELLKLKNYSNTKVIADDTKLKSKYPFDISFNVLTFKNYAIHNFSYTSKNIKKYLQDNNFILLNVSQGYSNCSSCIINDSILCTSDIGIINSLLKYKSTGVLKENLDLIYIPQNKIQIHLIYSNNKFSKMNGFFGGASCYFDSTFTLFGDRKYIDREYLYILEKKLYENKINFVDFKGKKIIDYGGIININ